jgi:hypothetical protein
MKQITELTEQEILTLTDEQLDLMVKYKMAEEGIKILEPPTEPVYLPIPQNDDSAFEIVGTNFYTKNRDVAEIISEAIASRTSELLKEGYTNYNYSDKYLKPLEDYETDQLGTIKQKPFYRKDTLLNIAPTKDKNKEIKEEYDQKVSEYNSAQDAADYIRVGIYSRYREVIKKYDDLETLQRTYNNYLQLAEGNKDIALNFLKKAYSVSEEAEYYVIHGEMPPVELEGIKID